MHDFLLGQALSLDLEIGSPVNAGEMGENTIILLSISLFLSP